MPSIRNIIHRLALSLLLRFLLARLLSLLCLLRLLLLSRPRSAWVRLLHYLLSTVACLTAAAKSEGERNAAVCVLCPMRDRVPVGQVVFRLKYRVKSDLKVR